MVGTIRLQYRKVLLVGAGRKLGLPQMSAPEGMIALYPKFSI